MSNLKAKWLNSSSYKWISKLIRDGTPNTSSPKLWFGETKLSLISRFSFEE